ncbi:MAG: SDR family oxidoreductase [Parasphingorhabdus sp.]|nr:SDR family oxidoreductase [Parasphingorhabdus sp.]
MAVLQDKVALVTGAAKGIGFSIAKIFAAEGAKVALAARTQAQADAAAARIEGDVTGVALDTSDGGQWQEVIARVDRVYGGLNILVNCAGITRGSTLAAADDENWDDHMAINLRGPFLGCRAALPVMTRDEKHGAIVNISSAFGSRVTPGFAAYSVSKAALNAMTQVLALECAAAGNAIRVNAVAPGGTETEMFEKELQRTGMDREKAYALYSKIHPMGRIGQPEEVARAVLWLASDASSFTTGTIIPVDGGSAIRS